MTPKQAAAAAPNLWAVADVAAYLSVKPGTITSYLARGQMPPPDYNFGRKPVWLESTIRAWRG